MPVQEKPPAKAENDAGKTKVCFNTFIQTVLSSPLTDISSYGVVPQHSFVYWHMASRHSQTCASYLPVSSLQSLPESPSRSCRLFSDSSSTD